MTRFSWLKSKSRQSTGGDVTYRKSTDSVRTPNISKTSSSASQQPVAAGASTSTLRKRQTEFKKVADLNLDCLRFHRIERIDRFTEKHYLMVAENVHSRNGPQLTDYERIAVRVKIGRTAYTEWLNEIQVYLLPNFKHNNVLPFLFAEKCYRNADYRDPIPGRYFNQLDVCDEASFKENFPKKLKPTPTTKTTTAHPATTPTNTESYDNREGVYRREEQPEPEDTFASRYVPPHSHPKPATSRQVLRLRQEYWEPKPSTSKQTQEGDSSHKEEELQQTSYLMDTSRPSKSFSTTIQGSPTSKQSTSMSSSSVVSSKQFVIKPEYWVLTDYNEAIQLRDYLRFKLLTWTECLDIAYGIVSGLHYLHENNEYQDIDTKKAVDRFIASTYGALKKVSFVVDTRAKMLMEPPVLLAIIHRNLSSQNIVLTGPNKIAKICNFGQAYIQHPFQPINHNHIVDQEAKHLQLTSPYSPPEVLQEKGHLTLAAMKSIDMYACGIIFWEILSRTRLPIIRDQPKELQRLRLNPRSYREPFEEELRDCPKELLGELLEFIVCQERVRPYIEPEWQEGQQSVTFVQTIQELWDQEFEARLHCTTVLDRLFKLREATLERSQDQKNSFRLVKDSKRHDRAAWIERYRSGPIVMEQPRIASKMVPNIRFEKV